MYMTTRELIMALVLNADLDDKVTVEIQKNPDKLSEHYNYIWGDVKRVSRISAEHETMIECDENE